AGVVSSSVAVSPCSQPAGGSPTAAQKAVLNRLVPLLLPVPAVVHPPCVCTPTASPVASSMTGLPELPPVVSTWYRIVVPDEPAFGPVCVCCAWLSSPESTP